MISRLLTAIRPYSLTTTNDTQIIINPISAEKETFLIAYVTLAASAALTVSDIPFKDQSQKSRVARIDGKSEINPAKQP